MQLQDGTLWTMFSGSSVTVSDRMWKFLNCCLTFLTRPFTSMGLEGTAQPNTALLLIQVWTCFSCTQHVKTSSADDMMHFRLNCLHLQSKKLVVFFHPGSVWSRGEEVGNWWDEVYRHPVPQERSPAATEWVHTFYVYSVSCWCNTDTKLHICSHASSSQHRFELNANTSMLTCWCKAGLMFTTISALAC